MSTEPKLCVLVNSLAGGGGEKVAVTLFLEYQRLGVPVLLLCLEKNDVQDVGGSKVHYLSNHSGDAEGGLKKLLSLFIFAGRLKRFVAEQGITHVQSHIYRANYVNVLARKLGSKHRVQIVNHGIASRYNGLGLLGKVNLKLMRWLYPAADQLLCPSKGMLDELKELRSAPGDTRVVGNPFDIKKISDMITASVSEDVFSFEKNKIYLLSIGRLSSVKRPQDIVGVLARLKDKYTELELIFLGIGEEKAALVQLAMEKNIASRIHFPGHVDNPYSFLFQATLFVSASAFEGFSNVIVESLASGTPVISTDCPSGPGEILAPYRMQKRALQTGELLLAEYGILVAVADVAGLANAVDRMLSDKELCQTYITKGKLRALHFDQEKIAQEYLEFLN